MHVEPQFQLFSLITATSQADHLIPAQNVAHF